MKEPITETLKKYFPIVSIVLALALLASLAGNGLQVYLFFQQKAQAAKVTADLNDQLTSANARVQSTQADLAKSNSSLQSAQADLRQANTDLQKAKSDASDKDTQISTLTSDKDSLYRSLQSTRCNTTLLTSDVVNASTNQALVDPITYVVDNTYSMISVSTTYATIWNNTKSSIFTIVGADKKSVKVIVSWSFDTNEVNAVYDVNSACLYYQR